MCEGYNSPIPIAGQYGGSLPLDNGKDIRVTMDKDQSEEYPILTIVEKDKEDRSQIYKGYLPIFGFSLMVSIISCWWWRAYCFWKK